MQTIIRLQKNRGFTLMELMVAVSVASVVTLSAFLFYVRYHEATLHLQRKYITESRIQIEQMNGVLPYGKGRCYQRR
ncbi:prepilin-type N-terminal cleavage/methylation domain-containing protein [Fibrobacter sp. HC4]|uniref:prepilin-type N-terminal cleavage/methylation domain-containing protein n=1 Tax=unclassified Fibrobacter TaxID=2634177 RepID=UPI000934DF36|nr:hypothetical protein B7993_03565 [Fibrobacter sp. UWH3]